MASRRQLNTTQDPVHRPRSDGPYNSPSPKGARAPRPEPATYTEAISKGADVRHPLLATPARLPLLLKGLDDGFFGKLTAANIAAEGGADVAGETVCEVRERVSLADLQRVAQAATGLEEDNAVDLLGQLGFVTICVEQQYRLAHPGAPGGFALENLPGVEPALIALGAASGREPCSTHETVWVTNKGRTFTGTDGERRFGKAVRLAEKLLGGATRDLDDLRAGASLGEAAEGIMEAARKVRAYRDIQADMVRRPFPDDFVRMRNHLLRVEVGGVVYPPPNATNAAGWTCLEIAVGLGDDRFTAAVADRVAHMPVRDAAKVAHHQALPSVAAIVAKALETTVERLRKMSPNEVAAGMASAPAGDRKGLVAACDLAREVAVLAGVHLGVIRANLPDTARPATHAAAAGVSGRPLGHTEDLVRMRQEHPLARTRRVTAKEDSA